MASYHDVSVKAVALVEVLEAMITSDRMYQRGEVCFPGILHLKSVYLVFVPLWDQCPYSIILGVLNATAL